MPDDLTGGHVTAIAPASLAEKMGVQPGDVLTTVNGHVVEDVIDVQFYTAEYDVEIVVLRNGERLTLRGKRRDMQPFGVSFEHPTFDIDIRRCNNLCEFCFVLQMAPRFRRTLYFKDDDYRYSFLFGHYVTLTNLSEHDQQRIVEQALSPLYVSVHATDLNMRREVLRNENAPDIMDQLRWLIDEGIEVHTQIVVTPGVNDGSHLEKSVQDLATLHPGVQSVCIVPVGLTTHHKYGKRPHTSTEAAVVLEQCVVWQQQFRKQFNVGFVYPTDEWYLVTGQPVPEISSYDSLDLWENGLGLVRNFIDDWHAVQRELVLEPKIKSLTLVTATLFAPTLKRYSTEFSQKCGVNTDVIPIINQKLGETITVAGLLMGQDVIDQLKSINLSDIVVLPRVMFDHPEGITLDDLSPLDIAKALQKPVALVDLMGDLIDIIYGKPALYFDPESEPVIKPDDIQIDGGWSVEKYL